MKSTVEASKRQFKLGMHTYTLHLSGCGESWGFQAFGETHAFEKVLDIFGLIDLAVEVGLDVLHFTMVDLDNNTSPEYLAKVRAYAEKNDVGLELNASLDAISDPRSNISVQDAVEVSHALNCQLLKYTLDVKRPEKNSHSCMAPFIMEQLVDCYNQFEAAIPKIEEYNLKVAIENHCDMFADEVIWLVEKLSHPLIGACVDTINSLVMMEGIAACIDKLAPYAFCVHFCDNKIVVDPDGTHSIGCAIGDGNLDCVKIMQILREKAPAEMDTIDLEIELPLSGYPIEKGRELEIEGLKKSIKYFHEVLDVGVRGR